MGFDAKAANHLADLHNNTMKAQLKHVSDEDYNLVRDIMLRIASHSTSGRYEFVYSTPKPIDDDILLILRMAGYKVELDGFTYKISWK